MAQTAEEVRKQFMDETKNDRWFTTPVCHGESAFASWEYQLWLEEKVAQLTTPSPVDPTHPKY